jgi:hypothetical protein
MKIFISIALSLLCKLALSQCDSVQVAQLLDSLRSDSGVCKGRYACFNHARCLYGDANSSYVFYSVYDSVNGTWKRYAYENNHLRSESFHSHDTMYQTEYDVEECYVVYTRVEVWNDSLSTSDEGGTVYDYERCVHFDQYVPNRIRKTETTTLVFRDGKPKQRTVCVTYWHGIPWKRKVYVYRAGCT